jgi:hypothetical protein
MHAIGREIGTGTQQVGLAHVERIAPGLMRDGVHHALDGEHALRAAKAPERRVGGDVGAQAPRADRDNRRIIGVGGMEHGAVDGSSCTADY